MVTEPGFNKEKSNLYNISIQVSPDGFSFYITNEANDKLLAYKQEQIKVSSPRLIPRRLKEWLDAEDIFENQFAEVKVIYFSKQFTIIPGDLIQSGKNQELIDLLFEKKEGNKLVENKLEVPNAALCCTISDDLKQVLLDKFPDFNLTHPAKIILEYSTNTNFEYSLKLFFTSSFFYVFLEQNKNLLVSNHFEYKHKNDVVYFVLSFLKQLKINSKETALFLGGNISKDEIEDVFNSHFPVIAYLNATTVSINTEIFNLDVYKHCSLFI